MDSLAHPEPKRAAIYCRVSTAGQEESSPPRGPTVRRFAPFSGAMAPFAEQATTSPKSVSTKALTARRMTPARACLHPA